MTHQTWTCGKCDMRFDVGPPRSIRADHSGCPECGQRFWHGTGDQPKAHATTGIEWKDLPEIAKEYIKP